MQRQAAGREKFAPMMSLVAKMMFSISPETQSEARLTYIAPDWNADVDVIAPYKRVYSVY